MIKQSPENVNSIPDELENMVLAVMLEFPGVREYFLRRISATALSGTYNRLIFWAMREMNGPVNMISVYQHLAETQMAARGIAHHLAMLNGLGWMADNQEDRL